MVEEWNNVNAERIGTGQKANSGKLNRDSKQDNDLSCFFCLIIIIKKPGSHEN